MKLDLIVPTFNRSALLAAALECFQWGPTALVPNYRSMKGEVLPSTERSQL
jgi:hypothetical protein